MLAFETNKHKILNNFEDVIKITYDTRIYKEYDSLATACLFNKVQSLCKRGEVALSNVDFSSMLGISTRTFKRVKSKLKDRIDWKIGEGNLTCYSLTKELPFNPQFHRSFELSHVLLMNNNLKAGAFLGQILHWWNKSIKKGALEFSMTDSQILDDLPFLSQNTLTSFKKMAQLKGFVSIKRKKIKSQWGISHYSVHPVRIEKAIKGLSDCLLTKKHFEETVDRQMVIWAKVPIECGPKSRLSVGQNPQFPISYIDNYLFLNNEDFTPSEPILIQGEEREEKERKKNEDNEDEQPGSLIAKYDACRKMISIWKDLISPSEPLFLSESFANSLFRTLNERFGGSVEHWRDYCLYKIKPNEWLMGKNPSGWKARLSWAIKNENIDKVLSGIIYSKAKTVNYKTDEVPVTVTLEELLEEVSNTSESERLKSFKISLINSMSKNSGQSGLIAFHAYLRKALFEECIAGNYKSLSIRSGYGSYNRLRTFDEIILQCGLEYTDITLYDGPSDRSGNKLWRRRKEDTHFTKQNESEENSEVQEAIKSFVDLTRKEMGSTVDNLLKEEKK